METRNSYFQIIDNDDSVFMRFIPALGEGENLKIEEVTQFLEKRGINDYDLVEVNSLITSGEEKTIQISNEGCYRFDEIMEIAVTPDGMYAVARFYPPSERGERENAEDYKRNLYAKNIRYGINEEALKLQETNPEYCKNIVVATGLKPVVGKDAFITYKFNVDRKAKPRLNEEDGTVDFHQLDNISHVKKGDILAVLTPEDPGISGKDVYGKEIKPPKVSKATLRYGNNISVNEDKTQMICGVDGHVTLEGNKVFVSDNYEVPADVDNSTGDIEYNGSITIKGNVRTGFKIKAAGTVEVFGVVEGAEIEAGGDIVLHRGVQGMGKAEIVVKGNMISKFIEGANVSVEGYIETDTILHSNVSANGDIYVRGKNGNLIGGNVQSKSLIEATSIGSPMGTATCVEVGTDPVIKERMKEIKKELTKLTEDKSRNEMLVKALRKKQEMGILEPEKAAAIPEFTKSVILCDAKIKSLSKEYDDGNELLEENKNAKIRVVKSIFQGVKVVIAGDFILIHSEVSHCQYKKDRAEIRAFPL